MLWRMLFRPVAAVSTETLGNISSVVSPRTQTPPTITCVRKLGVSNCLRPLRKHCEVVEMEKELPAEGVCRAEERETSTPLSGMSGGVARYEREPYGVAQALDAEKRTAAKAGRCVSILGKPGGVGDGQFSVLIR